MYSIRFLDGKLVIIFRVLDSRGTGKHFIMNTASRILCVTVSSARERAVVYYNI